jgi:hypothetical protein
VDIFQFALLLGALATAAIAHDDRRALLWIAAGALNFFATALYQAHPFPQIPHAFVTVVADGILVGLLSRYGRYRWEAWVRRAFMLSMLFSILYLSHAIGTRYVYVTSLEVCNWLALLIIGGTRIARLIDERMDISFVGLHPRRYWGRTVHRLRIHLDAPRPKAAFLSRAITRR